MWQTPTVTFRGICMVYTWCRCEGYMDGNIYSDLATVVGATSVKHKALKQGGTA